MPFFEPVFSALNEAGVRYVVVGGGGQRLEWLKEMLALAWAGALPCKAVGFDFLNEK